MHAVVIGTGAVGARAARQFATDGAVTKITLIDDDFDVATQAAQSIGEPATAVDVPGLRLETRLQRLSDVCVEADIVVISAPTDHVPLVEMSLLTGCHVVSTSDDLDTVEKLQDFDALARERDRTLVIGAGLSPGFACVLARHAIGQLDVADEVHIAKFGTGGPACARQHHKALRSDAEIWRNQQWEHRRGGTGRELCWFPDPIGGLDCYQAALPDPRLLLSAFPELVRVSARVAATRRDRATKWLPMLRRPHPEGMIGGVRVEVRGWKETVRTSVVLGALDRPAVAAGTVAAVAAHWAIGERLARTGAAGMAELVEDTTDFLSQLAERGVKAAVFEGSSRH